MRPTMTVLLSRVLDPDRRIHAIKALREVAVPTDGVSAKIGLKEAKNIVDDVAGFRPGYAGMHPPTPREVEVYADVNLADLRATFEFTEVVPDSALSTDIPRELVFELLMDAASCMDPEMGVRFRNMPAYRDVRARLA